MSCPTCGGALNLAACSPAWCPRCGTQCGRNITSEVWHSAPALVERVREMLEDGGPRYDYWEDRLRECVYPPEER